MSMESNEVARVGSYTSEAEAALVAAALEDAGIRAEMVGGLTTGFRAEAPGVTSVVVRREDLERARKVVTETTHLPVSEDDEDE